MPSRYPSVRKYAARIRRRVKKNMAADAIARVNRSIKNIITPNHLTVRQKVQIFTNSAGINTVGTAGNYQQAFNQSTSPISFALGFQLNDIPQYTTFTSLFDQYKILKVKVTFRPILNVMDMHSATAALGYPQTFVTLVDYDDATAPTSLDYCREYQSSVQRDFYKSFSITLKPKITLAAYSGTFTSYASTTGYIDVASPAVQHYGVKGCTGSGLSGYLQGWTISAEYWIDFRNIR